MDNGLAQNLIRLSMVSGYHALAKSDNAKLGRAIDCGLTIAILVTATWYVFVPSFWEAASGGKEIRESFWLSWLPLIPTVLGAAIAAACGYYLYGGAAGWFSGKVRVLFFLGLVLATVTMMGRVETIQRFRDVQAAYLNRCAGYLEASEQRQRALVSALSAHEKTLSEILETPDVGSEIKAAIDDLRAQLQAELDTLSNLQSSGREQAAEIESARAHDFRAKGSSPESYVESLANRKPGPELLGFQDGSDPLVRADGLALAASLTEIAVTCLPAVR
jgi:uncharacterized membrane protein YtjA (UPF0391 family)